MRNNEAQLRIKQSVERYMEIALLIEDIKRILVKNKNISTKKRSDVGFLYPLEESLSEKRWKNFSINTSRQLFGLNQKLRNLRRTSSKEEWNIDSVRLLAQCNLQCLNILKGLVSFKVQLEKSNGVVSCVLLAAAELAIVMKTTGFSPPEEQETDDKQSVSIGDRHVIRFKYTFYIRTELAIVICLIKRLSIYQESELVVD